jgi:hypothetical protein
MADQDPGTFKELLTPLGAALAFFDGLGGWCVRGNTLVF